MSIAQTNTAEFSRVRWQCRRGMLELDLLFENFICNHYAGLDANARDVFHELLTFADQDLFEYFFNHRQHPDKEVDHVINFIRRCVTP